MMKSDSPFRIRAYGRTELAQAYSPGLSPGAAYGRLMKWIALSPGLAERLRGLGGGGVRVWTPAQVAAIVDALGEP